MAVLKIRLEDRARKDVPADRGHIRGEVLAVKPDDYRPQGKMSRRSFAWVDVPDLTAKHAQALMEPDWADNPPDYEKLATDPNYALPEPYKPRKIILDPAKFRAEVSLADKDRCDDAWEWGKDPGEPIQLTAAKIVKAQHKLDAAVP